MSAARARRAAGTGMRRDAIARLRGCSPAAVAAAGFWGRSPFQGCTPVPGKQPRARTHSPTRGHGPVPGYTAGSGDVSRLRGAAARALRGAALLSSAPNSGEPGVMQP